MPFFNRGRFIPWWTVGYVRHNRRNCGCRRGWW